MSKCPVCALPEQTHEAIDGLLRNGMSLGEIAARCGITKSNLWRHLKHLGEDNAAATQPQDPEPAKSPEQATPKAETAVPPPPRTSRSRAVRPRGPAKPAVPTPPKNTQLVKTRASAPVELAAPAPAPPPDIEASRKRALDRTERLWDEVESCLKDAKKPVVIVAGDRMVEVPLDLKTRASVVRSGASVIDLAAKIAGVYDNQAGPTLFGDTIFQNVILMPKLPSAELPLGPVVDALPAPPALADDGADSEK